MFLALVGLLLHLRFHPPFTDPFSFVSSQGAFVLTYFDTCDFLCFVCQLVSVVVPDDVQVSWEQADCNLDATGMEGVSMLVDCSC